MNRREILFEGLAEHEILGLPPEEVNGMILIGEPIIFRAGSATILGSFKVAENRLIIELAQIDGGGEGVLLSLSDRWPTGSPPCVDSLKSNGSSTP